MAHNRREFLKPSTAHEAAVGLAAHSAGVVPVAAPVPSSSGTAPSGTAPSGSAPSGSAPFASDAIIHDSAILALDAACSTNADGADADASAARTDGRFRVLPSMSRATPGIDSTDVSGGPATSEEAIATAAIGLPARRRWNCRTVGSIAMQHRGSTLDALLVVERGAISRAVTRLGSIGSSVVLPSGGEVVRRSMRACAGAMRPVQACRLVLTRRSDAV